jgi:hypothetical protein
MQLSVGWMNLIHNGTYEPIQGQAVGQVAQRGTHDPSPTDCFSYNVPALVGFNPRA